MLSKSQKICGAIDELRSEEGSSVTIVNDNPDFGGPNSMIYVCAEFTGYKDKAFTGDNLQECLMKAVQEKLGA